MNKVFTILKKQENPTPGENLKKEVGKLRENIGLF